MHYIHRFRFLVILLLAAAFMHPTHAADTGAQKAFSRLVSAANSGDTQLCEPNLTRASQAYCDRFIGYGLLSCLPTAVSIESTKPQGNHIIVRVRIDGIGETPRYARLAYIKEQGSWKLDVPHTLRTGLGRDWEKRVNLMEQVYLIMRAQMGDTIDCKQLQALAEGRS